MTGTAPAKAYAVGYLRDVDFGDDIIGYLERIDETLAPYGGRFLVHGAKPRRLEGEWTGDLIVIEFPDLRSAERWYASPGYQAILPLRTRHANSMVAMFAGVPTGYRATDTLAALLSQAG